MQIYTDGSCHVQLKIGAWAVVILDDNEVVELVGNKKETTHNAMELLAVLKAIDFIEQNNRSYTNIEVITDSQYVEGILEREEKLKQTNFLTKKNEPIRNVGLVKQLIKKIENLPLSFIKVTAHQKKTIQINYNRVVDKMARAEVRRLVRNLSID